MISTFANIQGPPVYRHSAVVNQRFISSKTQRRSSHLLKSCLVQFSALSTLWYDIMLNAANAFSKHRIGGDGIGAKSSTIPLPGQRTRLSPIGNYQNKKKPLWGTVRILNLTYEYRTSFRIVKVRKKYENMLGRLPLPTHIFV